MLLAAAVASLASNIIVGVLSVMEIKQASFRFIGG